MKRVKLSEIQRDTFFSTLKSKTQDSWQQLARTIGISTRTLRDWRSGKHTVPEECYRSLCHHYGVVNQDQITLLPQFWYAPIAARKAGLAYFKKYGFLGNLESRRKGGQHALAAHKKARYPFFFCKKDYGTK